MLVANYLINYLTKQGSAIFKQGCKALNDKSLTDGFAMLTPDQIVIFVEAFHHRATTMGWNQGAWQITTPTTAKLAAIITQLQVQSNAASAAAAAPPAGTAPVVFADMPQMLGANYLINYLTKQGSAIFKQGCKAPNNKALTDGFAMTPDQIFIYVEAFHHCATTMGWNQGAWQITTFANSTGCQVDIIQSYSQIDKAILKSVCVRFGKPGEPNSQSHAKQNNTMMSICLAKLLTADVQARLLTNWIECTFDGVKYTLLMYKIIMHLAIIDFVATTQTLRNNLQLLIVYAATVSGNINKMHNEFEKNNSQLIAKGTILDNPIGILFKACSLPQLQDIHLSSAQGLP